MCIVNSISKYGSGQQSYLNSLRLAGTPKTKKMERNNQRKTKEGIKWFDNLPNVSFSPASGGMRKLSRHIADSNRHGTIKLEQ